MPYTDVPTFMVRLRAQEGIAARALEFTILTAARTGEVIGATWDEVDLGAGLWTVPAGRMKAGREHRVPLPPEATALLEKLAANRREDVGTSFVFPGARRGRPLSSMAMAMLLRRLNVSVTAHGFRSSFRDWAGEATRFPREIAEAALAHVVGDATERAYRRGDALEKRRQLMEVWSSYLERGASAKIVPLIRVNV